MGNPRWTTAAGLLLLAVIIHFSVLVFFRSETNGEPTARAQAASRSAQAAYFDLEEVFEASVRKQTRQAALESYIDEADKELKGLEEKGKQLQDQLSMLKPDTDEYNNLEQEIVGIKAQLEFRHKNAKEHVRREWSAFRSQHLSEIREIVRDFAEAQLLDLVLQKRLPKLLTEEFGIPSWELVFFARPELDITDEILALVNGK